MDMQQRLVLEHAYSALHSAGRERSAVRGQAIGVYVGVWADAGWSRVLDHSVHAESAYRVAAASCSMAAGRISYTLGLRGPSLSVDTACTAGLTACHIACGGVSSGECSAALAAGVNLNYFPDMFAVLSGFKEHQGRCFSFDHRASGFVAYGRRNSNPGLRSCSERPSRAAQVRRVCCCSS